MSILPHIKQLIDAGKLIPYAPTDTCNDFRAVRTILFSEEMMAMCPPTGPSPVKNGLSGKPLATARALLEDFVGGAELEEDIDVKLLDPEADGVWELRIVPENQDRQVRFFGWFDSYDCFVVTHCEYRDVLGDRGSKEWKQNIDKCKKKRVKFGNLPMCNPHLNIKSYLSNVVGSW